MTELLIVAFSAIGYVALVIGFIFFIASELAYKRQQNKDDCDP